MDQTKSARKTSKSRRGDGKSKNKSQNQAKLYQNKLESKLAPTIPTFLAISYHVLKLFPFSFNIILPPFPEARCCQALHVLQSPEIQDKQERKLSET